MKKLILAMFLLSGMAHAQFTTRFNPFTGKFDFVLNTDAAVTKGNMMIGNDTMFKALILGTDGMCLLADSTQTLGVKWGACSGGASIGGSGTTGYLPKWTGATTLGDSLVSDDGSILDVAEGLYVHNSVHRNAQIILSSDINDSSFNGLQLDVSFAGDGTGGNTQPVAGIYSVVQNNSDYTAASLIGLRLDSNQNNGMGSVTTNYGLKIENQTVGGTNYSAWFGSGNIHLDGLTASRCLELDASKNITVAAAVCGTGGSSTFDAIGSGTNTTATMTVGTGGTINRSGSGIVDANQFNSNTKIAAADGGTAIDTSASTGVLRVSAGTWSANAGISHLAASTSAALRGVLSDENGTGPALFNGATTPDFTTGFTIGAAGATGKIPIGDGTNYVPSTPTFPNSSPAAGRYLKGDGTNWGVSTGSASGTGTCTNQVVTALSSDAAPTCTTVTSSYTSGTFPATAHNLLSATHGDTSTASPVLGDILVGNSTPAWARFAGNTTSTKKFLNQTGNGAISALPSWDAIADADLPATITRDSEVNVTGTSNEITSSGSGVAPTLSIASTFDISGKTSTAPIKKGTSAATPATCNTGEFYFKTDATLGQQLYACTSTNTWTLQGDGGGGGGDSISVNGTAATDADFDDATPAAPASAINVAWQKDTGTPNNISANLVYSDPLTVVSSKLTMRAPFRATASATVANTTTETSIIGTGSGSKTISANTLAAGDTYRLSVSGNISTADNTVAPTTIQLRCKFASTVIADSLIVPINTYMSNAEFDLELLFTVRTTGASGTIFPKGKFRYSPTYSGEVEIPFASSSTITIDTTASSAVDAFITWGAANAAFTITGTNAVLEKM